MRTQAILVVGLTALFVGAGISAQDKQKTPRDALQVFNDQIGSWTGTGTPVGSRDAQQDQFWTESMAWKWQFKGDDAWVKISVSKGKYFLDGTLRYIPEKDHFEMVMRTVKKETKTYVGKYANKGLTVECKENGETDRLVFTFLHSNRFLYRQETRKGDKGLFTKLYQVGCTKDGEDFAVGDGKPECIVSGGLGTAPVMYKMKTYYVCCSGCRDEFLANAEKYIAAYEAKKNKKTTK